MRALGRPFLLLWALTGPSDGPHTYIPAQLPVEG